MADLRVNVAGVEFQNPLIAASGTFGFGHEYNEFYPLSALGGISCKGITIKERPGNPPPRVTETPGGMLNAVGLQNPGVDHFIEHDLPWLSQQGTKIIANVAGNAPEDYCATVEKLNDTCVDMVELNISCPNVKQGGVQFGTTTEGVYGITSEVRKHCKKPLMVKLSPNVTDISEIHSGEKVVSKDQLSMEDFYEHLSELGQLGIGKNRVEVITSVSIRTETVEDKAYYDVFNTMHVTQIYAQGAVSVDKITPASDPITLPVRVLEEGDAEYSPAPELSATFTPDTAVTVGEFNEFQGLAIDYYYPMVDAELSEGYDIQAGYTVSIPLENYQGETLSGTLTIPLPQGYDGATARIKGGASASSYTATTVTFPLTLDVSGNTAEAFELLIEYREAQEPDKNDGATSSPQTGDSSNAVLWIALLFASGVGLFGAVVYSRKKRYNLLSRSRCRDIQK